MVGYYIVPLAASLGKPALITAAVVKMGDDNVADFRWQIHEAIKYRCGRIKLISRQVYIVMYTDSSSPSHLDEVRRGAIPTPIDVILAQVISLLPAAELPLLRRVSTLWHATIDLELVARIGPTVLDAGGISTEVIEFWIHASRAALEYERCMAVTCEMI